VGPAEIEESMRPDEPPQGICWPEPRSPVQRTEQDLPSQLGGMARTNTTWSTVVRNDARSSRWHAGDDPARAPHTFADPSGRTTGLLNTFTPNLYVQHFRDLRDIIAHGQQLTPEATIQVMSRYATVPATEFASPAMRTLETPASIPLETP
jgi:hypothetical protein